MKQPNPTKGFCNLVIKNLQEKDIQKEKLLAYLEEKLSLLISLGVGVG